MGGSGGYRLSWRTAIPLDVILLGVGFLIILSVLASKLSTKLGIPALVLFIGLGMLAGEHGPGRYDFNNFALARDIGTIALALILFSGGLDTKWKEVRQVLPAALSLATLGVLATAAVVALAAHWLLALPLTSALLLGAILSSTDAAAVFGVMRGRRIHLKPGLMPLLEMESGSNDPMAIFLTTALTGLIARPETSIVGLIPSFAIQMSVGALVGCALGYGGAWLINRLRLEPSGLYPPVTLALALLAFGGAEVVHGNAFLSVYLCGLVLGNQNFLHRQSLMSFHEGLSWLAQIFMFLVLGLLVTPHHLIPLILPGMLLSAVLVLLARPFAVVIATLPFRWLSRKDKMFVSWTGLRGAVPIILATIPLTEGLTHSETIFNIVFFAVLVSVLVQGTLIGRLADRLGVRAPGSISVEHAKRNTMQIELRPDSPAAGRQVVDLKLPRWALLLLVERGEESFVPQGSTVLEPGDVVLLATRKEDLDELALFVGGIDSAA